MASTPCNVLPHDKNDGERIRAGRRGQGWQCMLSPRHDPGRTRACNLWSRRPRLYPLGHKASCCLAARAAGGMPKFEPTGQPDLSALEPYLAHVKPTKCRAGGGWVGWNAYSHKATSQTNLDESPQLLARPLSTWVHTPSPHVGSRQTLCNILQSL